MNIVILGPGAIGSLWAIKLKQAGHHVSLWSRSSETQLSLQLDDSVGDTFLNNHLLSVKSADLIVVTVKAWQVEEAISPLLGHIHPDTIVMLMHNGMGTAQRVSESLKNNPIVLATTTHGAYKPCEQKVLHTGHGNTQLGGFNNLGEQCQFLQEVMHHALPEVGWNPNINAALWTKLAINCAINPLTAIHQCKNGALAQQEFQDTLRNITRELVEVMNKEGLDTEFDNLFGVIMQVVNATAENYSSMRQDVYHQRRTEIDFITGYLLQTAEKHHIETPENLSLYQRIKQIEKSWTEQ
ncbi:2-dehydropantoate 2-reductase [Vibrio natriegens]|uniref:2-dehydropantoate 2-reductase n=1 Tax=Vibrio natriegens NBRC 15636 = ATCC 14048 = DSM 759 TaxID=1219067 RepID=A0AAN0Y3K8_VIBNA|nr:2-dehydropantoate 2-reductase [Vibrio natriegens]ALR14817.1 2-dehydropantoate 2-reductase [Vibrio natriegens NBRC 15636 = ATCC 14048 = DSM 759]ANQ13320.1 2-dehydropantoate 2-reductase [Vibrio natriegens NBRC 15636 = ATCC 14048 = DSM 759]EPM40905.1 2-dehydropantoate 2-reductase [Vibrio natriegens NBRC 15636 = ATCC 14048 = DSM 759]MDX6027753.1 2-dehydropantoate 2-reductase [Vibrio natriegens NBRC 15636 = ATCC 14048 = DSM 759]UUI11061.1 2-dehydropantoate 2-reductase [Vibrio natriegens]